MISLPPQANSPRLRCDRALPACSNCRCRPEIEACIYTHRGAEDGGAGPKKTVVNGQAAEWPAKTGSIQANHGTELSESLHAKIVRLEKTINRLMGGRADVDPQTKAVPSNPASDTVQAYLQSTHGFLEATQPVNFSLRTSSPAAPSPTTSVTAGEALWVTLLDQVCAVVGSFGRVCTSRGHCSSSPGLAPAMR